MAERVPASDRSAQHTTMTLRSVRWGVVLPIAGGIALGLGAILLVQLIARPIAFLIVAIAIAEALAPLVSRAERWMPRSLAIGCVYLVLLASIGWFARLVVPSLVTQAQELINRSPELVGEVQGWIREWDRVTGGKMADVLSFLPRELAGFLVSLPLKLFGWLVNVLLVLFLSIYWLVGSPSLERFALSFFPDERQARTSAILHEMGEAMGGYVRGSAISALLMGSMAWIGLTALGVNYAFVLATLTLLAEFVPLVGPIAAALPVVGVAFLQSPTKALLALGLYAILQQIESHLLTPNIMRRQTDVPQTLVLFAVIAGGTMGGVLGILASIPLAAAVRVFLLRVVVPAARRRAGAEVPVTA